MSIVVTVPCPRRSCPRAPSALASPDTSWSSRLSDCCSLLLPGERPARVEPDEPGVALAGVDDEPRGVVEPVVQVPAGRIRQFETEAETTVCERQGIELEPEVVLRAILAPAELRSVLDTTAELEAGIVVKLERKPRRRHRTRRNDPQRDYQRRAR